MRQPEPVLTRERALRTMTRNALDNAVGRGRLVRAFPRVYVVAECLDDPHVRRQAALAYAGSEAALSHTTALAVWGLYDDATAMIHVIAPSHRRLRAAEGIAVHRRAAFATAHDAVVRNGLCVTRLEQSIVDSWPVVALSRRRDAVIRAVSERMTTPERLRRVAAVAPNLRGRAELLGLIHLLDVGCRSELEIWGHAHVFLGPGMPRFQWQRPVRIGRRTVYLDVYAEPERVNFELDGAAWHASPTQRERDLKRDAALATMGIVVVRFSHQRLTRDPEGVRREVLAILRAHRAA